MVEGEIKHTVMDSAPAVEWTGRRIRRVLRAVESVPWAIEPGKLAQICELLELKASGYAFTPDEVRARLAIEPRGAAEPQVIQGVALIPVHGVLAPRMNLMMDISGGTSTQVLAQQIRQAAADPDVREIVLDIDSPGGDAIGNEEVAQLIREVRQQKPVTAVATNLMASAAYYIGSAATEVVASPSAEIGSIGTYLIHFETSRADENAGVRYSVIKAGRHKAAGNRVEPLTSESRQALQERVDALNSQFVAAVAANRGRSVQEVNERFGEGKVFLAAEAKSRGMIDRVATLAEVLAEKTRATGSGKRVLSAAGSAAATNEVFPMADELNQVSTPVPPQPTPPSDEQARNIALAERQRIAEIRASGAIYQASAATIEAAIAAGEPLEAAVRRFTRERVPQETPVVPVEAAADRFAQAAAEALCLRAGVANQKLTVGKDLRYARLVGIAKGSLEQAGIRVADGMPADDIARAALRLGSGQATIRPGEGSSILAAGSDGGGFNRPSDLPDLLANVMGKMVDGALAYSPATYRMWAAQIPAVPDFKPKTLIGVGGFSELAYHPDGDEFTGSTVSTDVSWIATDSYGDEFSLTPKMIVDDDLGVLTEAARDKPIAADLTLNRLCVNLLTGNVAAGDGTALFHATHANDRAAGGPPSQTELAAMRLLLRSQTGIGGVRALNLPLYGLLIPEDIESATEQVLDPTKTHVPVTDATVNTFRGRVQWWVEPMIGENSTTIYYGFVNPSIARAIVYCHQQGFEGGYVIRQYVNPKNNCLVWQVESRMAAAVRQWRGVVRNNGA